MATSSQVRSRVENKTHMQVPFGVVIAECPTQGSWG